MNRAIALSLLFALAPVSARSQSAPPADGAAEPGGSRYAQLYAVASARMLTSVNRNDATAAIKAWFGMVGKERGFALDSKIDVLSGSAEMLPRLRQGNVHILILDVADYLRLEPAGLIEPVLVGNRGEKSGPRSSFVLLTGAGATGDGLSGLRGKSLSYYSRGESNVGLMWLDLTLDEQRLGRASVFFASARRAEKPQECVLGVFFGKVDACLVDETNFELLKEMNPQLAQLRPLGKSMPLVEMVIAIPVVQHPYRQELLQAALELHQSARGKQILMVFKTSRLVRATRADFDAARALLSAYSRLKGDPLQPSAAQPNRALGAGPAASPPSKD